MKSLLKYIEEKHQELLVEIAVYKHLLYEIADDEDVYDIKKFITEELEDFQEKNKGIGRTSDVKTFLTNLAKDKFTGDA